MMPYVKPTSRLQHLHKKGAELPHVVDELHRCNICILYRWWVFMCDLYQDISGYIRMWCCCKLLKYIRSWNHVVFYTHFRSVSANQNQIPKSSHWHECDLCKESFKDFKSRLAYMGNWIFVIKSLILSRMPWGHQEHLLNADMHVSLNTGSSCVICRCLQKRFKCDSMSNLRFPFVAPAWNPQRTTDLTFVWLSFEKLYLFDKIVFVEASIFQSWTSIFDIAE